MTKLSKDEVNYSLGMIHSHCGKVFNDDTGYCKHFQPTGFTRGQYGSCTKVEGGIKSIYWCKEFEKAKK